MIKSNMPNVFIGAPFMWPQGTFNFHGQFRGQARVTNSPNISWTIGDIGPDGSISVRSNSGHNVWIQNKGVKSITFDPPKKAFTIPNLLEGVLLFNDHARRINVTNTPDFNGERIFVAELADGEEFGRICTSKGCTEVEMKGLVQLAKKTIEGSKHSIAVHTLSKQYVYPTSESNSYAFSQEFITRDQNSNIKEVILLDEILAVEVI